MSLELEQTIVDARDPRALGLWWRDALGWVVVNDDPDEFEIRPTAELLPGLLFVSVAEPKSTKNRLHLRARSLLCCEPPSTARWTDVPEVASAYLCAARWCGHGSAPAAVTHSRFPTWRGLTARDPAIGAPPAGTLGRGAHRVGRAFWDTFALSTHATEPSIHRRTRPPGD